ncbi:MAG: hypothetical protein KDC98_09700 [Planctomycetes bacterium]|nr:hypothetical protein [Planctomycetota bacterium]
MRRELRLVTAVGLSFALLPAQQTFVVGTGGTHPTITAAIAAAAAGDTVLVIGGSHYDNLDIDKGINLISRGASLGLSLFGQSRIHDIPVGQTFTMSGFTADPSQLSPTLTIRDCGGLVALDRLAASQTRWYLAAQNCRQLHVADCGLGEVTTVDTTAIFTSCVIRPVLGGPMDATRSRIAAVACRVPNLALVGQAFRLFDSDLAMTRCDIDTTSSLTWATGIPVLTYGSCAVVLDPDNVFWPNTAAPVQGSAAVATQPITSTVAASDGQRLTTVTHGAAGTAFITLLSLPIPAATTPLGLLWLDLPHAIIVDAGVLSANRLQVANLPHPTLPAGLTVALQSAYLAGNNFVLGLPTIAIAP